ncbi:MAG: DUF3848 domain-containing protein [Lachnospiraceae bacterium]|nr:DUF3848 domain-containing protein [Lachnospiraceae bacterium]
MRDRLIKLFCLKINVELEEFKNRLMGKEPKDVYKNAYLIDTMISLEEVLLEKSRMLKPKELRVMIRMPNLLRFLYDEWLDVEDSRMDEFEAFVDRMINEMTS